MKTLNENNGAETITLKYVNKLKDKFKSGLVGAELGVAYGGGVENIGKAWRDIGIVYGFDTFDTHPRELSYDPNSMEAICMDDQYRTYGSGEVLTYEYQRKQLDAQGLNNVILRKGLLNIHSLDDIPTLHYALLDLDILVSMALGILLVKDKIVSGGYLCLHDCVPKGHIWGNWGLYQELMAEGKFDLIEEAPQSYLVVLKKK